jgi:hypothetical protein
MWERGNRLSRTLFVEEVEVLDAELRARFAESNGVHEEVVEGGQDLDCEQNQTLRTRRRLWKRRKRRPDSEPELQTCSQKDRQDRAKI